MGWDLPCLGSPVIPDSSLGVASCVCQWTAHAWHHPASWRARDVHSRSKGSLHNHYCTYTRLTYPTSSGHTLYRHRFWCTLRWHDDGMCVPQPPLTAHALAFSAILKAALPNRLDLSPPVIASCWVRHPDFSSSFSSFCNLRLHLSSYLFLDDPLLQAWYASMLGSSLPLLTFMFVCGRGDLTNFINYIWAMILH